MEFAAGYSVFVMEPVCRTLLISNLKEAPAVLTEVFSWFFSVS
jgi:hypothetical protein